MSTSPAEPPTPEHFADAAVANAPAKARPLPRVGGPLAPVLPLLSAVASLVVVAVVAHSWVVSISLFALLYTHEMGHVVALRLKGMPASAPIFVPLVGAFVVMGQVRRARDAAEIALAGPFAGMLFAVASLGISVLIGTQSCAHPVYEGVGISYTCFRFAFGPGRLWLVLAHAGFLLNLANLLPLYPLDGGRVAGTLSRWLWLAGIALSVLFLISVAHSTLSPTTTLVTALFVAVAAFYSGRAFVRRRRYEVYAAALGTRVYIATLYVLLSVTLVAGTLLTQHYLDALQAFLFIPRQP